MSHVNLAHEVFVAQMIAHGNRIEAYQIAYPGCSRSTAAANASRLLADPAISQRIIQGRQHLTERSSADLLQQYRDKMTTLLEKRHELGGIIRGEKTIQKTVTKGNKFAVTSRSPNFWEILSAIELDSKLEASMMHDQVNRTYLILSRN